MVTGFSNVGGAVDMAYDPWGKWEKVMQWKPVRFDNSWYWGVVMKRGRPDGWAREKSSKPEYQYMSVNKYQLKQLGK